MKKILFAIASLGMTTLPVVTAISCSRTTSKQTNQKEVAPQKAVHEKSQGQQDFEKAIVGNKIPDHYFDRSLEFFPTPTDKSEIEFMKSQGDLNAPWLKRNEIAGHFVPKDISIPSTVKIIGDWAFAGAENAKPTTYGYENTFPEGFTIPDGVTKIGERAFMDCKLPEGFTIPASVTEIGDYAFAGSILPKGFTIPSTVKKVGIGMFSSSTIPAGFALPSDLLEIPADMFTNATIANDFKIPSSVVSIGQLSFAGVVLPENFAVPKSVKTIKSRAFDRSMGTIWDCSVAASLIPLPLGFTIPSTVTSLSDDVVTQSMDYLTGIGAYNKKNPSKYIGEYYSPLNFGEAWEVDGKLQYPVNIPDPVAWNPKFLPGHTYKIVKP